MLHLPGIVEAAESSPPAAREAANQVRKFLTKDNFPRPFVQYNAIMLVRILADNPGKSFTRNLDTKFIVTVKELLRDCADPSVQQILRETLDTFETQKPNDETLAPLREMWKKEKAKTEKNGAAVSTYHRDKSKGRSSILTRNSIHSGLYLLCQCLPCQWGQSTTPTSKTTSHEATNPMVFLRLTN